MLIINFKLIIILLLFTNKEQPTPLEKAKCFTDGLAAIGWRHSIFEAGIVHDGLHVTSPIEYEQLRQAQQVGCKDQKF